MDRAITASEANQRFSEMLRDVADGHSFTVTSRGKPVARVTPISPVDQKAKFDRLMEKLSRRPMIVSGPWTRNDLYD